MNLMVMVPTRGRRARCERLLESFVKTTDSADIMLIIDPDDEETYEGMDLRGAAKAVLEKRSPLSAKLNGVATVLAAHDAYDALMFVGDDHVFTTSGWDTILMGALDEMGGTGFVYPDDKRRNDVPEIVLISTDIIRKLGFFAEPSINHYYLDNVWGDLGKRSDLIRFVPEAVIEHHHYQNDKETERDETYRYAEETWGVSDQAAWQAWQKDALPFQVAVLRREFNPDVKWILGKV